MKNRTTILNSLLAVVVMAVLLVCRIWKLVKPNVILPELDIPAIVGLSLIALLATSFFKMNEKGSWIVEGILAAITFGILPWAAGFAMAADIWKLALAGGIVFVILNGLFQAMLERLETLNLSKIAAVPTAFALYLACQCFSGWIL